MSGIASIAPVRPQHMEALEVANRVRLARARLKRSIAEGALSADEVIRGCPWEAESMTITDLLLSQRRWGVTRCRKFLNAIPMSENKTLGSMTERQRRALSSMLCGPELETDRMGAPELAGFASFAGAN